MVVAAICNFMPCWRIIFPVSAASVCIWLTNLSIWSIYCCYCYRIFLLSSCLLPASSCPVSCYWLMEDISTAESVFTCAIR
jgi:hypothetical protein